MAVVPTSTTPSIVSGATFSAITVTSRGELTTALIPAGADSTRVSSTASSGQRRKARSGRVPMWSFAGIDERYGEALPNDCRLDYPSVG